MSTALITGPTSGIGAAFADQLAAAGHDLVLVARDAQRLEATAQRLRTAYGVGVETLAADLSDREQLDLVARALTDPDHPVDVLVNNAGHGLGRSFLAGEIGEEERMLDVLCRAVLVLSHAAARAMTVRGRGRIVNVSSVAGLLPSGSYSAAKAYVTVLTESLSAELAGTGVSATALCPGLVHTEFHDRAQMDMSGIPEFAWIPVEKLVHDGLADAGAGRPVSVPGWQYKTLAGLVRLAPRGWVRRAAGVGRARKPL